MATCVVLYLWGLKLGLGGDCMGPREALYPFLTFLLCRLQSQVGRAVPTLRYAAGQYGFFARPCPGIPHRPSPAKLSRFVFWFSFPVDLQAVLVSFLYSLVGQSLHPMGGGRRRPASRPEFFGFFCSLGQASDVPFGFQIRFYGLWSCF